MSLRRRRRILHTPPPRWASIPPPRWPRWSRADAKSFAGWSGRRARRHGALWRWVGGFEIARPKFSLGHAGGERARRIRDGDRICAARGQARTHAAARDGNDWRVHHVLSFLGPTG